MESWEPIAGRGVGVNPSACRPTHSLDGNCNPVIHTVVKTMREDGRGAEGSTKGPFQEVDLEVTRGLVSCRRFAHVLVVDSPPPNSVREKVE